MQRQVEQKLAEMGMTDAFFAWLRREAPPHVARESALGLYCARAMEAAMDDTLALSDRLGALLRYEREEEEFIASQPQEAQALIRGPTTTQIARFKALVGERQAAVDVERDLLQRAPPRLLRERERLFERMAPMTAMESAAEERLLQECADLIHRVPIADPEQSIDDVVQAVRANPAAYDTSEFEKKIMS
jgi:hypothetical protein